MSKLSLTVKLCSSRKERGAYGRGVGHFLCKSQVSGKHLSDSMGLESEPRREHGNRVLRSACPAKSWPQGCNQAQLCLGRATVPGAPLVPQA